MTEDEAIAVAKQVAEENGWTWVGSGLATRGGWRTRLAYAWGRQVWEVRSHGGKGCVVLVVVQDATARVVRKDFTPARPLTRSDWHACPDPEAMLEFLWAGGKLGERKARLFAVACWRYTRREGLWKRLHRAVDTAERYADGLANRKELLDAKSTAWQLARTLQRELYDRLVLPRGCARPEPRDLLLAAYAAEERAERLAGWLAQAAAWAELRKVGPGLLRNIFGDPPVLSPSAFTAEVLSLARAIYEHRSFERMYELADALDAAGCEDASLLSHCRGPGPHARGCWALGAVLGKA